MKTTTDINITTIKQRVEMLNSKPIKPVSGRGHERVELTNDSEVIDWVLACNPSPHLAAVSVREPINRFGKLGTPKKVFCSPEFYDLFK